MGDDDGADGAPLRPRGGEVGFLVKLLVPILILWGLGCWVARAESNMGAMENAWENLTRLLAMVLCVLGLASFIVGFRSGTREGALSGAWMTAVAILGAATLVQPSSWALPVSLALVVLVPASLRCLRRTPAPPAPPA